MKIAILVATLLSLTGCGITARQQATEQQNAAFALATSTCDAVAQQPELASLWGDIPVKANLATVAQLASDKKPSEAQKRAILKIDEYEAPCRTATLNYLSLYAPAAAPIYEQAVQDTNALWARLYSDGLTFGQFNTERARIVAASNANAQMAESSRVNQQRQIRAQEYQNYLQLQRNMDSIRQSMTPKTTNCYTYGNQVQCTQY